MGERQTNDRGISDETCAHGVEFVAVYIVLEWLKNELLVEAVWIFSSWSENVFMTFIFFGNASGCAYPA